MNPSNATKSSKSAPIIGLPCRHDVSGTYAGQPINAQNTAYLTALVQAGGIPLLIPLELDETMLRAVYERLDGVMLCGGGDIDPANYSEPQHETVSHIQIERDRVEITLARWAAAEGKPLLGICRGIQVMAVAVGGTLWQDIPSCLPETTWQDYRHSNSHQPRNTLAHSVTLIDDSDLARIVAAERIMVNSLHHQAIKRLPTPYRVIGQAPDGVIEAIDRPDHPFWCGVQWHPEEMMGHQETARKLFAAFVGACKA